MVQTSRFLQVVTVLGFGCTNLISASVHLTASYTGKDGVSFLDRSEAVLTCSITPYTGSQTWIFDSVKVADCGAISCVENTSNPDRYFFTPNIATGTFIFIINPVSYADNQKVIECFDGINTGGVTMIITDPVPPCDIDDYIGCIILVACELYLGVVWIQNMYIAFILYSGSNRNIWRICLLHLSLIPFTALAFSQMRDENKTCKGKYCKKQTKVRWQCLTCNEFLCGQCNQNHFNTLRHIKIPTKEIKEGCSSSSCESSNQVHHLYYCLNCQNYLCTTCVQDHPCLKNESYEQGKHECRDCTDKTCVIQIYCFKCKDYLCKPSTQTHFRRETKNEEEKKNCKFCDQQANSDFHCLTCNEFLCKSCNQKHFNSLRHIGISITEKYKCSKCESRNKVRYYCLFCQHYLCTTCVQDHFHSDLSRKMESHEQGKHACPGCSEETQIYCLMCKNYLCKLHAQNHVCVVKYKVLLAMVCIPFISIIGVVMLWFICWNEIKEKTGIFIVLTFVGSIVIVAHPYVVLPECILACESNTLGEWWYIAVLVSKYTFLGWIPVAILLVFIRSDDESIPLSLIKDICVGCIPLVGLLYPICKCNCNCNGD